MVMAGFQLTALQPKGITPTDRVRRRSSPSLESRSLNLTELSGVKAEADCVSWAECNSRFSALFFWPHSLSLCLSVALCTLIFAAQFRLHRITDAQHGLTQAKLFPNLAPYHLTHCFSPIGFASSCQASETQKEGYKRKWGKAWDPENQGSLTEKQNSFCFVKKNAKKYTYCLGSQDSENNITHEHTTSQWRVSIS